MFRSYSSIWGESDFSAFERERPKIVNNFGASALPGYELGPLFPSRNESRFSNPVAVLELVTNTQITTNLEGYVSL